MNGYVTSGRQLQFGCEYDSTFSFISFQHNGTQISSGDRISISSNDTYASLVVSNTQATDGGAWSCIVKKSGSRQFTLQTFVTYAG